MTNTTVGGDLGGVPLEDLSTFHGSNPSTEDPDTWGRSIILLVPLLLRSLPRRDFAERIQG